MVQIRILPKDIRAWVSHGKHKKEVDTSGGHVIETDAEHDSDSKRPSEIAIELYPDKGMVLRDFLALDRTVMSNEQSLLAYLRTGLAFAAAGVALLHFNISNNFLVVSGAILIGVGIGITMSGFVRFRRIQKILQKVKHLGTEHALVENKDKA